MSRVARGPSVSLEPLSALMSNMARAFLSVWRSRRYLIWKRALAVTAIAIIPFLQAYLLGVTLDDLVRYAGKAANVTGVSSFINDKPLGEWPAVIQFGVVLVLMVIVRQLLPFLLSYLRHLQWHANTTVSQDVDVELIEQRGTLDLSRIEDHETRSLWTRVKSNGASRFARFEDRQYLILQCLIEVAIAISILGVRNWLLLLVLVVGALPGLISEVRYGHAVWTLQVLQGDIRRKADQTRQHFELLPWLYELFVFGLAPRFTGVYEASLTNMQVERAEVEDRFLRRRMRDLVISQIVAGGCVIWAFWLVLRGELPLGQLVLLITAIEGFRLALSGLNANFAQQWQDSMFVSDVFKFLELKPMQRLTAEPVEQTMGKTPEIRFERVSFRYPGQEQLALREFSLTIAPGEQIALVGSKGGGRTTFVKLLARIYDPTTGRILIDGVDLRKLDVDAWRARLGVVNQSYGQYQLPVGEVIALRDPPERMDHETVLECARMAGAESFIASLDRGYDEVVGPDWTGARKLSAGEWQQLAIARALYKLRDVLVLDEPTSDLDAVTQAQVLDNLRRGLPGKTQIMVSHRMSAVRASPRIVVLKDGTVEDQGTHEELVRRGGTYAQLARIDEGERRGEPST